MTGCTVRRFEQLETSPETIERARIATCSLRTPTDRQTDRQTDIHTDRQTYILKANYSIHTHLLPTISMHIPNQVHQLRMCVYT